MSRPLPKYLTSAEVADILRIRPTEVGTLVASGRLRAYKPGKSYLIDPADLEAYIKGERAA